MRIISGKLKGRRIHPPKNLPVRPTTDRAKEALFNILVHQYDFESCSVLDLFAGTGSISYEFASRGVKTITAVDQNNRSIAYINETSESLSLPITTVRMSVTQFLERLNNDYTFVFADPPYTFTPDAYQALIHTVFERSLLQKNGLLIVEHAEHVDLSAFKYFTNVRNYGGCVFSFFEN